MELEAIHPAACHHSRNKRFGRRTDAPAIIAAIPVLGAVSVHAYGITTSPYLADNWGGLCTRLAGQGMNFNLGYGSEMVHNFSGGTECLTHYIDQWVISTTLNLQKFAGWQDAVFQITVTDRNGHDLGSDTNIDNSMPIQEVHGRDQIWYLTQFWLNQKLPDSRLEIRAGRVMVDEDFSSFLCDFQNLTFYDPQPGDLVSGYRVDRPIS